MKKYFLHTFFLFLSSSAFSQQSTFLSKSELGPFVGGSYYLGDLNTNEHFTNSKLSLGLVYRYNIHSRLAIRANALYGNVYGYDADSKIPVVNNRNLNFHSSIYELGAGIEFTHLPYIINHPRYFASGYLFAELALFRMNPKTRYDDEYYELRSLGTEGQGTDLSDRKLYNLTQLSIPLGMGFKVSIGDKMTFALEYGIRKTFTDYLDDVGSARYVDPVQLEDLSGPIAAALSNRSLDPTVQTVRGNPNTKDWYVFYGAMMTIRLGNKNRCPSNMR